jgi:hypothetical protein
MLLNLSMPNKGVLSFFKRNYGKFFRFRLANIYA